MTPVTKKTILWLNIDPLGELGNSQNVVLPLFAEPPGGFTRLCVYIFI